VAGPVVDVLLRAPLTAPAAVALIRVAAAGLGFDVTPPGDGDRATIARVVAPSGHDLDVLLLPADHERDPGELDTLAERAGYRPAGSLQLMGWVRRHADRDQARLALALMGAGAGDLVELGGDLLPPRLRTEPTGDARAWAAVRNYTAARPGRLLEIPYQTWDGRPWLYHVVDAAFLQTWLDDPDFHLPN
jgi:hypothetical protein